MDATQVTDVLGSILSFLGSHYAWAAPYLAILPVLQVIGKALHLFLPANTIAAKVGGAVAAFPMPAPAPVDDGSNSEGRG
jgi:hypothetical protein